MHPGRTEGTGAGLTFCGSCEALQQAAPAHLRVQSRAGRFRLFAEALDVAVLQLDPGRIAIRDEAPLHFRDEVRVEPPLTIDLPGQHQLRWRLPGQHAAPSALRTVLTPLEPAPTHTRFDGTLLSGD